MGRRENEIRIDLQDLEGYLERKKTKVDGTRTEESKEEGRKGKKRKKTDNGVDFEAGLGSNKERKEEKKRQAIIEKNKKRLEKKKENGYNGGKGLQEAKKTEPADFVEIEPIVEEAEKDVKDSVANVPEKKENNASNVIDEVDIDTLDFLELNHELEMLQYKIDNLKDEINLDPSSVDKKEILKAYNIRKDKIAKRISEIRPKTVNDSDRQEEETEIKKDSEEAIERKAEKGTVLWAGKGLQDAQETKATDNIDNEKINELKKEREAFEKHLATLNDRLAKAKDEKSINKLKLYIAAAKTDISKIDAKIKECGGAENIEPLEPEKEESKKIGSKLVEELPVRDQVPSIGNPEPESSQITSESFVPELPDKPTTKKGSEAVQGKKPKQSKYKRKGVQKKLTANYFNKLLEREELNDLAKKPSPELMQEAMEENQKNITNEKEGGNDIIASQSEQIKNLTEKNDQLYGENLELKEIILNLENQLAEMKAQVEKRIDQEPLKNQSAIKKFMSNPKVKAAIIFGLTSTTFAVAGPAPAFLVGMGYTRWKGKGASSAAGNSLLSKVEWLKNKIFGNKQKEGIKIEEAGEKDGELIKKTERLKKTSQEAAVGIKNPETAASQDGARDIKYFERRIELITEAFSMGEIKGEQIYEIANLFYDWVEVELDGKEDMQTAVWKKIYDINPEIQAKMVKSMLEYAMINKKDNKEAFKMVKYLTMRNNLDDIPGVDEEAKKWLLKGEKEEYSIKEKEGEKKEDKDFKDRLIEEFSVLKKEFEDNEDKIDGKTVFTIAQFMESLNNLGGKEKEIANNAFNEIFPVNSDLRGAMVDAMAVYADSIGMSGKEVAKKYLPFFEVSSHIGRSDVYKWLLGEIKRLPENIQENQKKDAVSFESGKKSQQTVDNMEQSSEKLQIIKEETVGVNAASEKSKGEEKTNEQKEVKPERTEKKETWYEKIAKDKTPAYVMVKIPTGSEYNGVKEDSKNGEEYREWRMNNWNNEKSIFKEAKENELLIKREGSNLLISFIKKTSSDRRYADRRGAHGFIGYQLPEDKMEKIWNELKNDPSNAYELIDPELVKLIGLPSDLNVVLKEEGEEINDKKSIKSPRETKKDENKEDTSKESAEESLQKTEKLIESKKQFVDVEIFERVLKFTKLLAKKGSYGVAKNINSIIVEIFDSKSKNEGIQQRLRKIREIGNIEQSERLFVFNINPDLNPEDISNEYNKLASKISANTGIDTFIPKKFLEKVPELVNGRKLLEANFILAIVEDMLQDKRLRKLREIGF